jgi:hypothetical protein
MHSGRPQGLPRPLHTLKHPFSLMKLFEAMFLNPVPEENAVPFYKVRWPFGCPS